MKNNKDGVGLFGVFLWGVKGFFKAAFNLLKKWLDPLSWRMIVTLSVLTWVLSMLPPTVMVKYAIFILILAAYILYMVYKIFLEKRRDPMRWLKLIMLGGMVMRMLFVLMSGHNATRWHDDGAFAGPNTGYASGGHFGYMEYIMKHWSLPPNDPVLMWSYYNPPLFYVLEAVVMWVTNIFVPVPQMYECIQILPMLFSGLTVWQMYQLLKDFKVKKKPLVAIMAVVSLHSWFALAGMTVTMDSMVMFLAIVILRYLLKWLKEPVKKNTVKIALLLGLAGLTKLSAVMLIPAIIFAFLYKKQYKQLFLGLIICAPMMLFNPMRMVFQFRLSPIYTQTTGFEGDAEFSPVQHLIIPAAEEFTYALPEREKILNNAPGGNIWMMMIRQAMFDETTTGAGKSAVFEIICYIGFYAALLMVLFANVGMIKSLRKKSAERMPLLILVTAYVTALICFFNYNMDQPFFCTTSYRYVGYAMLIPLTCSGVYLSKYPKRKFTKMFYIVAYIFVAAIVLVSVALLLEWVIGAGWENPKWVLLN